jgi:hypothetical protein
MEKNHKLTDSEDTYSLECKDLPIICMFLKAWSSCMKLTFQYVVFEAFTATTMKMLGRVAPVKIDVSEERSASIIMVVRIGELGITSAVTRKQCTLRRYTISVPQRASVASYC